MGFNSAFKGLMLTIFPLQQWLHESVAMLRHNVTLRVLWLSYYSKVTKHPYEKLITEFSKLPYFLHNANKVAISKTQPLYYTRYQAVAETLMRMSVL